jgi:DsbC/DsbD-like thiol-disulfide interchange protein
MLSAALFVAMLLVAGPPQETAHLKIATTATPETAKPGAKIALAVDVTPKAGMHVYAPGQDGYIAITVKIDPQPAFSTTGKPKYPEPEKFVMPALNETQLVYNKPFRITQDITLATAPKLGSGPLMIKGSIRYQACNDTVCFLPTTIPVTWTINPATR